MSLDGNRCINCGAKMKLVHVTRINTFRTPEAGQYDISVSRRQGGSFIQSSSRELLCTCCGFRIPADAAKTLKPAKEKQEVVKKEKAEKPEKVEKVEKVVTKKIVKKRFGMAFWIKLAIFLAVLAVCAYFAYEHKDTLLEYWDKFKGLLDKAKDLLVKAKGFIEKIASKF
jgi:hypothetical protein